MSKLKLTGLAAFAFLAAGPLQHVGATPRTLVGDTSKLVIKSAIETVVPSAHAGGMCAAAKARARAKLAAK